MPFLPPLAQDYAIVDQAPSPAEERCPCDRCRERDGGHLIIDDVALTRTPDGNLLATYTFNRDSAGGHPRRWGELTEQWRRPYQFQVSRSTDGGRTWHKLPPLNINMGQPFVHDGVLYLIGNKLGRKDIIVMRSDDNGASWSDPVTLFEGNYWNTPAGMAVRDGTVYRVMGTTGPTLAGGGWNSTVVVAGELAGDLLDPAAWRISNALPYPGTPPQLIPGGGESPGDHWLEGNAVNVNGRLRVLMRCRVNGYNPPSILGLCDLDDDGSTLTLSFRHFYPVQGAQQKLYVIHDDVSGMFWTQGNIVPDPHGATNRPSPRGGDDRGILVAMYSLDALNWFQAGCLAIGTTRAEGFQYAAPLIDGDDMLYLVRTAPPDGPNQHDATLVTLHRLRDFRSHAYDIRPK